MGDPDVGGNYGAVIPRVQVQCKSRWNMIFKIGRCRRWILEVLKSQNAMGDLPTRNISIGFTLWVI
jgi:hypothetical protein